jgi:hypothetical protein
MPSDAQREAPRARGDERAQPDASTADASATDAAVRRSAALRRRGRLGRFAYENGLVLVAGGLFLLTFVGQILTGRMSYNREQRAHGEPPVGLLAYLATGAFLEATAENWESEFLQMGVFVVLTVGLYQRGSSESKKIEEPESVDQRPEQTRADARAPWPVRHGGVVLTVYKHSLSLALLSLFLVAFALHAVGGAAEYSAEQRAHGGAPVTAIGYLATSRFWFESFQNWQSEFLSVAVLVLLSVWLREQGSPQSKPVAAGHEETGA